MPYINSTQREKFEEALNLLSGSKIANPGELNYLITKLFIIYLDQHGLSYQRINDILGAADGASKEFYERVVKSYEINKREINGDVYSDKFNITCKCGKTNTFSPKDISVRVGMESTPINKYVQCPSCDSGIAI